MGMNVLWEYTGLTRGQPRCKPEHTRHEDMSMMVTMGMYRAYQRPATLQTGVTCDIYLCCGLARGACVRAQGTSS